jgi:hypothetical protein
MEYVIYMLFLLAWTFGHGIWLVKLSKQVKELEAQVAGLRQGDD